MGKPSQLISSPTQLDTTAFAVVGAALAASPLLAAWTVALVHDERGRWWRPRRVRPAQWAGIAVVAAAFAGLGAHGDPTVAWWLLAVSGAVLAVTDARTLRLPARLLAPLALTELITLSACATLTDQPGRLVVSILAALTIGGIYFLIAFAAPSALGLGDVHLAGITAALLGWIGWRNVMLGQELMFLLGAAALAIMLVLRPQSRRWNTHLPLGPALILGTLLASWL